MKKDMMKWLYTFVLLFSTLGWAVFCVVVIRSILKEPTGAGVLEAAGVSVLLGALITWNGAVNQFWFRKKSPPE